MPGPWEVIVNSAGVFVERRRITTKCESGLEATQLCDSLNAAEQVRDAAPALLAACKESLEAFEAMGLMGSHLQPLLKRVIKSAEGA